MVEEVVEMLIIIQQFKIVIKEVKCFLEQQLVLQIQFQVMLILALIQQLTHNFIIGL
jgi:hypothetical protein